MNNTNLVKYDGITRVLHWMMALLVLWQFMKFFDRIDDGEHWVGQTLVPWHLSIGALLLVLMVLRILWVCTHLNQRPLHDSESAGWINFGHFSLYAVLLMVPISGVLRMVGGGKGLKAFGYQLIEQSDQEVPWASAIGQAHSILAWCLLILVVGHIVMALYHQLVKRDGAFGRIT